MQDRCNPLIIRMQQSGPKVMSRTLPVDFLWTILQPVGQSHVTVGKVDGILSSALGCNGVLLGQDQTHNLTQSDVLQEELHVQMFRWVFGRQAVFIVDKVVFANHFDIRVVGVDMNRPPKSDSHGPITSEESPPDAFPETFIGPAQLRAFDAGGDVSKSAMRQFREPLPSVHSRPLSHDGGNATPVKDILCDICAC